MEKVIRNGKVAVLYSPGYGAGWYTENPEYPEIVFHPKLVELVEQNRRNEITKELCQKLFNTDELYVSGAEQLVIEWLNKRSTFKITQFDGYESLTIIDEKCILTA